MMRINFLTQTNTVLACRGSWSPSGTSQLNFLIESRPQESFFQAAALEVRLELLLHEVRQRAAARWRRAWRIPGKSTRAMLATHPVDGTSPCNLVGSSRNATWRKSKQKGPAFLPGLFVSNEWFR
jgi:hypothetical protein